MRGAVTGTNVEVSVAGANVEARVSVTLGLSVSIGDSSGDSVELTSVGFAGAHPAIIKININIQTRRNKLRFMSLSFPKFSDNIDLIYIIQYTALPKKFKWQF